MVAGSDGVHHFPGGIHLVKRLPLIIISAVSRYVAGEQDKFQIVDVRLGLVQNVVRGINAGRDRRIGMYVGNVDETESSCAGRFEQVIGRPGISHSNLQAVLRSGRKSGNTRFTLLNALLALKRHRFALGYRESFVGICCVGRQSIPDHRSFRRCMPRDVYFS